MSLLFLEKSSTVLKNYIWRIVLKPSWKKNIKQLFFCFCFYKAASMFVKVKTVLPKKNEWAFFFWKSLPQYLKVIFYILKPPWKKNNKQPFSSVKQLLFLFFVFPGRLRCLLKLKLYYQKEWMTVCFLFIHR